MKIAIIGHKRIPSNEGGIEKGVEQHAVRMVQRGNDVTVYNRGGHNVFGKEFDGKKLKKYKGINIVTVPTVKGAACVPIYSFLATIHAAFSRYDYGNCCLISDIPENTEVVHDKALSFEKGNETDLQKKLQMLLDDENLVRKYKKEAAPYILDRYNWDIVVDQMLRVYAGDVVDYNTVLQERESRNGVIQSK